MDNGEVRPGNSAGLPMRVATPGPLQGMGGRFGWLKVRPKLMVLHNAFFLVLTCAVYLSVAAFAEQKLNDAAKGEVRRVENAFAAHSLGSDEAGLRPSDLRTGAAGDFGSITQEPRLVLRIGDEGIDFLSAWYHYRFV